MSAELAVQAGGIFCLGFAVFHLAFWKLFDWRRDLVSLRPVNRAVMQVLNLCLTFAFLIFAWVSLVNTAELLATALGRTLTLLIAVFWYLRAAEQVWFFGLRHPVSILFLAIFLLGGTLYLGAWLLPPGPSGYAGSDAPI